jgi:hypothetical protein
VPRLTAIELSGDACVLAAVRVRGAAVRVERIEILDPSAYPGEGALSAALSGARRTLDLPKRARVVLWGLRDGASLDEPSVRDRLAPLSDAGFRIDRVVSPQNALSALARLRIPKSESATIWLAIDRSAVAIVAARPGELLYSHAFQWNSSVGATGSQARLLQRYSLVAFLAPEVRRAIAAVRERGGRVDTVITCGTLPDLRSLTMPLIEELDVEVETLDSLDGIVVQDAVRERAMELAPSIRLACAGAVARPSRFRDPAALVRPHKWLPAVAALALLAIGASSALLWTSRHGRRAETPSTARSSAIAPAPVTPRVPAPAPSVVPTTGRPETSAPHRPSPPTPPRAEPARPVESQAAQRRASTSQPVSPHSANTMPAAALKDPLPSVSTILVSENRQLAMVDGQIVSVGDRVGRRTVAEIEPHAVRFREPSGFEVRVGLGGRERPFLPDAPRVRH